MKRYYIALLLLFSIMSPIKAAQKQTAETIFIHSLATIKRSSESALEEQAITLALAFYDLHLAMKKTGAFYDLHLAMKKTGKKNEAKKQELMTALENAFEKTKKLMEKDKRVHKDYLDLLSKINDVLVDTWKDFDNKKKWPGAPTKDWYNYHLLLLRNMTRDMQRI